MIRILAALIVLTFVASCGSGRGSAVTRVVGGPITSACMQAARTGATLERCGCVQAVANDSLSSSDQRRGAAFFTDPQRAQEIRQSSSRSDSEFWERWSAFSQKAAELCE
ncbi:arginine transporter [Pseudooceanicola lipolyticus]|uniref:arginine transporter n=1 Tax=Pseudooceanicola lipolyticus TaxID=2029104 RepID=UPI001F0CC8C4|nr:arginine transporter [Pseudooceanicola lipolyticus]